MISNNEIVDLIKGLSLKERLMIVGEILRNIREDKEPTHHSNADNLVPKLPAEEKTSNNGPAILTLAGIISAEEANALEAAVAESRMTIG